MVVEVVAEPTAETRIAPAAAVSRPLAEMVESTVVSRLKLAQAPQPRQGPSGQLPVGGSPEVEVATAKVVVVADCLVVEMVDVVER